MSKLKKYLLSFTTCKTKMIITYSKGQFKRLEYKGGGVKDNYWKSLTKIIPFDEHLIAEAIAPYEGRVIMDKVVDADKKSLYSEFMGAYFSFFEQTNSIKPKVTAVEGKALKQIIGYLVEISATEDEALTVWKQILSNWNKLDEFYQKQQQIRQINSNLPNLIIHLKNGGSNKTSRAKHNANDLRESL